MHDTVEHVGDLLRPLQKFLKENQENKENE